MRRPVVAGVDGSPASLVAAEHAAYAATAHARPLRLVHGFLHSFDHGLPDIPYRGGPPAPDEAAQRMLTAAAAALRRRWPGLTVRTHQAPGGGTATLVDESRHAELVVVGNRARPSTAELLLGSIDAQVAGHAHCSVLVVRPPDRPVEHPGPVVVGVDGSESGQVALAVAADEAARRSRTLVVAHVWDAAGVREARETYPGIETTAMAAAGRLAAAATAAAQARWPGVVVVERLLRGPDPARALVASTRDAALLVVGSRPRESLTGTLLGSVGQRLLQHAPCPVLIARAR